MDPTAPGMCSVCGGLASIHFTEIRDGQKTERAFCLEHAPPEIRDKMPYGPHRTSAEEVAYLRLQLVAIDQQIADPARRAEFKAEIDKLIADIEAGRRRIGDAD